MANSRVVVWHIGDVVRKLREAWRDPTHPDGLSRKELAARAQVRANTLGDVERGVANSELKTLGKIAIALNVTVEGLYAELPGVQVPTTTDPLDAETIALFLQSSREERHAVRVLIDTLRNVRDPKLTTTTDAHHAQPAQPVTPPSRQNSS